MGRGGGPAPAAAAAPAEAGRAEAGAAAPPAAAPGLGPAPAGAGAAGPAGEPSPSGRAPPRRGEAPEPPLVVFSGGTAFNAVAPTLQTWTRRVAHVLPVSDDGGSTAEIVRVLGGPAVGDIRSRCLRLADTACAESSAVDRLLAYRLPKHDGRAAKREWAEIVDGDHPVWEGISEPYKNTVRAFLVHFQSEILRQGNEARFNFANGSVGNFFFAGARTFFNSLEAAIFLFSRVARIPEGSLVLPVVSTNERLTLGAELRDGTLVQGQNNISHPAAAGASTEVAKGAYEPLPSPVRRVFYLSQDGSNPQHEVWPDVNPSVLSELRECEAVVFGMGSLYTSLCPSLVLRGVGETVAALEDVPKVLVLNSWHDREIHGYSATQCVLAVRDSLNRSFSSRRAGAAGAAGESQSGPGPSSAPLSHPASQYITHVVIPRGGSVFRGEDRADLARLGICSIVEVETEESGGGRRVFAPERLVAALRSIVAGERDEPCPPS